MALQLTLLVWLYLFTIGLLFGLVPSYSDAAMEKISSLPSLFAPVSGGNPFFQIFLKNSLASLTIIYLGILFVLIEVKVYTVLPEETYGLLKTLTKPLYKVAEALHPPFKDFSPFFRSCYFFLNFVPLFAIGVNGVVMGLLLTHYPIRYFLSSLMPHGLIEFPAMVASVVIALNIARDLKVTLFKEDFEGFTRELQERIVGGETLRKVIFIQLLLLLAAYLEVK